MFISDLKSAIRSIFRNRLVSLISILGLGIGLGCTIVLLALIVHERSFNKFMPESANVYRIIFGTSAQTPYPLAESMAAEFPGVKDFFRYTQAGSIQVKSGDNTTIRQTGFGFADPSIFRITGIDFISGGPALLQNEVALSRETAIKLFGDEDVIGKLLPVKLAGVFTDMVVKGVYEDFPPNSTMNPSMVADIKMSDRLIKQFQRTLGDFGNENNTPFNWTYNELSAYVVLDRNSDPEELASSLAKYKEFLLTPDKDKLDFRLQPVSEIYLDSEGIVTGLGVRRGNKEELIYYEAISLLILIISLTNYILLARAKAFDRTHEFGTRKVFGAGGPGITRLILTESFLMVILSLIPAVFVIDYGMDFVNEAMNKTLSGGIFLNPKLWLMMLMVVLLTGLLTGLLIGRNFSRRPLLGLLAGKNGQKGRPGRLSNSFLVVHFTIYILLVSSVSMIYKQINYSTTGYVGIDPRNVLVTYLNTNELKKSFEAMRSELEKIPGVIRTAGGSYIPPFGNFLPINLANPEGEKERFDGLIMGEGMVELLGIEVIDGTSFGPFGNGPISVILNESSAIKHNVKAGDNFLSFHVLGIVRDFHAHSLHSLIQPMVILQQNPASMALLAVKTSGQNDKAVIDKLRELYATIAPDEFFEATYLTDVVEGFYTRERNLARIVLVFSILAAILSVMGLFGISLIGISRKKKQIGIRKVNGASTPGLMLMLNFGFIKWVFAAMLISVPLAVYLLNEWIERFAYRTELSWWVFAAGCLSACLIAIITISWHSWKASTRNPVEALRYE